MNREEQEGRLSRGVIGYLTAGFEMLGQNLLMVALPVVLDVFLWLGPRVSLQPLLQGFVSVLRSQQLSDPEMSGQVEQAMVLLEQFGEEFNLLSVLGGVPMFQVPSLLARRASGAASPLGSPRVVSLSSALAVIPWWSGLALIGLVLGFLYLNEIAHQIQDAVGSGLERMPSAGEGRGNSNDDSLITGLWKFLRFLLFAFGLVVIGSFVFPLWMLIVALGTSIVQPLGILLWVGGVGLLSYVGLHLLFVIPSLLLGGRRLLNAIGESVLLSHLNLSSVFGYVLLAVVIYEGLGYAWLLAPSDSWAMVIGIVGNAFVATGLTGAAFIFYRDRVVVARQMVPSRE